MKNNYSNRTEVSSEKDFLKFFSNKMSDSEKSKFISNSETDEFEKEAINGYKLFPNAVSDIDEINNKVKTKSKNFNSGNNNIYIFTASIIIVSMIIVYFIFPTNNKIRNNNILNNNLKNLQINNNKINAINIEINKATESSVDNQITVIQTKTDQVLIRDYEKINPLEKIKNQNLSSNKNDTLNNENISVYINMPTSYMYEFKVVDYSKIYNNKIKTDIFENNGLSAKYENHQNNNNQNFNPTENNYITYNQFLTETMGKLSVNNYKEALQNFVIIIEQFPNDQNSHFYGGLCYFNLGLYQKSIEHFNSNIESKIIVFAQEAEWYKTLSLINLNENSEAKECLKKIISAKGFYSKRASEKLSQIEK